MTPRREKRFRDVLDKRQSTISVLLENVHDPHNISAVMRTCDAVGIQEIYLLNTVQPRVKRFGKKSSASAREWLNVVQFSEIEECFTTLRKKYQKIYATHLIKPQNTLYKLDLTESVVLVFGNEKSGVSEELLEHVDDVFIIPQVGMIQSLNISVACAVTLYEAFRQRDDKGLYDSPEYPEEYREALFQKWADKNKKQPRVVNHNTE